jgi:anti-sigma B factor antagonist
MASSSASLMVSVAEQIAFIKISGRATVHASVGFKALLHGLLEKKITRFILDLSDCATMDSTFLGVLAGFALKLADEPQDQSRPELELFNPNHRVSDLLENLGVAHLFQTVQCPPLLPGQFNPAPNATPDALEVSRTCLEAHRTLVQINAANVPKFKDVMQFLAEDLKKKA